LVIGGSATATSVLKNLVLPGIGHFTILDSENVSPHDAGNNFFLDGPASIGKNRAEEAVKLLLELNDSVEGMADTRNLEDVLASGKDGIDWILSFTIVITHNMESSLLGKLSNLLWQTAGAPSLVVVKTAGFLAEFSLQFHEHPSKFEVLGVSHNSN
jgi:amyloid beta precursor protein binding protein 1